MHTTLTHPAYAGAYAYGRTRQERYLGPDGVLRVRRRELPRDQWEVLITDHHEGFTDWDTYLANQHRIGQHPPASPAAGHRRGPRGLRAAAGPGHLRDLRPQARRLLRRAGQVHPRLLLHRDRRAGRRHAAPGTCASAARRSTPPSTGAFLAALAPAALQACLQAAQQLEHGHDAALDQWRRQVEQARYDATRAERRYRAVDPDNRLVARGLETEWETALQQLADADAELARRQAARPKTLTAAERAAILALGDDLGAGLDAPTTTDKDRKQLLRTLLEEVTITVHRDDPGPTPTCCCGGKAARSAS